ncbi:MAG: hypothetical protein H0T76_18670 [Nannocystis sp.]|nr:hypothetical protein [Nannocystis sp.]MBA3548511.1 hypothetical protein [Nannocystis sp.]
MPRPTAILVGLLAVVPLIAVGSAGCATTLVPAPGAHRVAGVGYGAEAEQAGVHIVASAAAWRGFPSDLDDIVEPMLVTITNDSGRSLEIRYEHFDLLTPGGVIFVALPPFQISVVTFEPAYGMGGPVLGFGFSVAPYLSPWYPGWTVYGGPFPFHSGYYAGYYPYYSSYERITLPTGDMIQKALPEGVLAPGGRITGFLYFEQVTDVSRVAFVARLIELGGQPFGQIQIPFVAQ